MKESKDKKSNNTSGLGDTATDFLKNINTGRVINSAQLLLNKAVDVLEEEIAAGILAAKNLEKKVINVEELRSNPEELMGRIRNDVHEAVDIFLDAFTALTHYISNLSGSVNNENNTSTFETKSNANSNTNFLNFIQNDGFAKAGETVELSLALNNESKESIKLIFQKPDLLGPQNKKILSRHITIQPASLILEPDGNKEILLKIKIPKISKAGTYSGLLCDENNINLRALINVHVT